LVCISVLALVAAATAAAAGPKPTVVIGFGGTVVSGKPIVLTATARNATMCTFLSQRGPATHARVHAQTEQVMDGEGNTSTQTLERLSTPLTVVKTVSCASGRARVTAPAIVDRLGVPVIVTFEVVARRGAATATSTVTVGESPA
jgi:hypothetical protein